MVFTSNCISANQGGEGIALSYAALTFVNNTVAFNGGKGLRLTPNSAATTNIFNNIIWGNQATGDGSDITMNGYGAQSNFFNNLYASAFAIWDNQSGNLVADPLFLDAANGNFHVAVGSPAINAGLNTAPSMPEKDQEGNARILDGTVDIGAYERSTMAMHPADLNSNWIIEESELSAYVTAWKNNTAWVNGPNPIPMNYVSRAGYLSQKGGTYRNNGGERPTCWVMP